MTKVTGKWSNPFIWAALLWMTVIFLFSARPGPESSMDSAWVGMLILRLVRPGFSALPKAEQLRMADGISFIVRKCAHATEYAILSGLIWNALKGSFPISIKRRAFLAWGFTVLYAITDEIHQMFVPGRSCELRDVLIDAAGALAGLLICIFLHSRKSESS